MLPRLALALLALGWAAGQSPEEKKLARLSRLASKESIIQLSDKNFTKYALQAPRPYAVAVVFNAMAPDYGCEACRIFRHTFKAVADMYRGQYDLNTTDQKLVFFEIDVDRGRQMFGAMQLQSAPHVYVLPESSGDSSLGDLMLLRESVIMAPAERLLKALHVRLGIKIEVRKPPGQLLVLGAAFTVLLAFVASWAASFDTFKDLISSPRWYIAVSWAFFATGVSGIVYSILNSPQLFSVRDGMLFHPANRSQFALEGFLVVGLMLLLAVCAIVLFEAPRAKWWTTRHLGVLLGFSAFAVLFIGLMEVYLFKTGFYRLSETFPPEVWNWISSSIKRKTGIPKRLFRLGQVFLFEFQSWGQYYRKVKTLLLDYVYRVTFPS